MGITLYLERPFKTLDKWIGDRTIGWCHLVRSLRSLSHPILYPWEVHEKVLGHPKPSIFVSKKLCFKIQIRILQSLWYKITKSSETVSIFIHCYVSSQATRPVVRYGLFNVSLACFILFWSRISTLCESRLWFYCGIIKIS